MKCSKCNRILPEDSEFCQYCGNRLSVSPVSKSAAKEKESEFLSKSDMFEMLLDARLQAYNANKKSQPNNEGDPNFGLVPEKPIYTLASKSVAGEKEYLSRLRTPTGERVTWSRRGSVGVDGINGMVDIYDVYLLSGQKYATLYINMYGAKASESLPSGFAPLKARAVKNNQGNNQRFVWDIAGILTLLLDVVLCGVGAYESYYNVNVFMLIFFTGIGLIALKILHIAIWENNDILTVVNVGVLLFMTAVGLYTFPETIVYWIVGLTILSLLLELCKLSKIAVRKYRGTQHYKMKCYRKIDVLNSYREKGVITEEEFESLRKQIVSKIR